MSKPNVTRGKGLLEGFLAKQRSRIANKLIPSAYRRGRILDIGCGTYPFFLINTKFSQKYGLDKVPQDNNSIGALNQKISFINYDIEREGNLSFDNEYFDVITMLAVFEHIEPKILIGILRESFRVLKWNGMFIMTTPARYTDSLLKFMAKLRLVSPSEIEEHKQVYSPLKISSILQETGFKKDRIQYGYFEMFMNIWVTAMK